MDEKDEKGIDEIVKLAVTESVKQYFDENVDIDFLASSKHEQRLDHCIKVMQQVKFDLDTCHENHNELFQK